MAEIRLQPPEPFNFRNPDDWQRWKRRFQQFREASGLNESAQTKQVSTLLYCLGEEAEAVLSSTNATSEERKDYEKVIEKFDSFFQVRKNVIFERARFNRRKQQSGETAEEYIVALYDLTENCNYGDMKEEMIRDRLVVGIRDKTLSEKLQMDSKLTLETAKKTIRQKEAVHEQQQTLKGTGNAATPIDSVNGASVQKRPKFRGNPRRRSDGQAPRKQQQTGEKCGRCGRERHSRDKCPAKDAQCHNCKRVGHYSAMCRQKTVSTIEEDHSDSAFLDTLCNDNTSVWTSEVNINGEKISFKLDTGAEVTAISKETWKVLGEPTLQPSDKHLFGPAQQSLSVLGKFSCHLSHKRQHSQHWVFVVDHLKSNLLGLPAITALHLAVRTDTLQSQSAGDLDGDIVLKKFPQVFQGLGTLAGEYHIQIRPDAKPHAIFTPRHVPFPLRSKVAEELDRMEKAGVISKVTEPTEWCAGMVVVPKKSGKVRICVDLKPLNRSVLREVHPLPKVDETLAQLSGAKVFSKLDANSGFWQIPLSQPSRLLTTFITPMGRYCFNKLPFGISSAPEHFQRRMSEILAGLEGVLCQMDDVLIFGRTQAEHDRRLEAVLTRIEKAGVTLNPQKCEFSKNKLTFLGHVIDANGITADPEKTKAIVEMDPPTNVPELRRFLGMANQLGKFTPKLAEMTQPLRELLSKSKSWTWGPAQSSAFLKVKQELSKPTTLALYDPSAPTKIAADASAFGLGAVILQKADSIWKPVAFASRSMSDTERRYAQIEKEALATTWACEKFADFIIGKHIEIETDHKPLVPLLGSKDLDRLPPRVLRFRLRLDRFSYDITHVPGKELYTADTLSRAPVNNHSTQDLLTQQELAELCMMSTISHLPASDQRVDVYKEAQSNDPTCQEILKYCREGWPNKSQLDPQLKPFYEAQGDLTEGDGLLMYDRRIVVPKSLQTETLQKLHEGHQGLTRCRLRAKISVWWPGISKQLKSYVENCPQCARDAKSPKEPLIPTPLPAYPWQKVATDLFHLDGKDYIVIVDYFSRFPEVKRLQSTTTQSIINTLKTMFARYGIPEIVRSDNGPQFSSQEFTQFAQKYNFKHITSSPHFPASNGQAERAVQTVKKLLKDAKDPFLALLAYRATPLPWCKRSPAELLMGRNIRSTLPVHNSSLLPEWSYIKEFQQANEKLKQQQKSDYDRRHRVRDLPEIPSDTDVWVTTGGHPIPGRTITQSDTPRSYIVETPTGETRRNRSQLNIAPPPTTDPQTTNSQLQPQAETRTSAGQSRSPIRTRSRTGTHIAPPDRLS